MKKSKKTVIIVLLIGTLLMFTTTAFANSIKEFILVQAEYPIFVNDSLYTGDLPLLNYEGSTYVPLRAMSELLNVDILWNQEMRQVEITHKENSISNNAFRNILVSGSDGKYTVAGEARVFEATLQYEVEDGHIIYLEGFETASGGAPDWGIFKIDINIPKDHLPQYGQLTLILFEESADDGSRINELAIPLEIF